MNSDNPLPAVYRLACALVTLTLLGCGSGTGQKGPGAPGGPPGMGGGAAGGFGGGFGGGAGMPIAVITSRVAPQSFTDRFTALGTARANESIEVTARTTSVITRINFREGQRVRTGDVLVDLDNRQEWANLQLAEAQLKQAENQYKRSQTLAVSQAVSAADLDQLEANLLVARAQVRGAQARLDILSVRAPFAGTVGLRRVSLGDLVGPDTVITTLDDTSVIKLEFGIPENFVGDLRTGNTIVADSTVYPDRRFKGTVTSIDSRVDPVTRAVTVLATVPNDEGLLKPGMFLTVGLEKKRENVLLIPEEALVPREGRQYVFVVEDGKAMEREVVLGGRAPGLAEIRSGLESGVLLITEGTQRVRTGAPVQVAPGS
ncbi:MAG: efflux RND transporter periplasmic adaptor subunit [Chromatiales bacterium]|nr:efflux RND transporter periplasmic adaptor subunit [Chromatiales bacterium]